MNNTGGKITPESEHKVHWRSGRRATRVWVVSAVGLGLIHLGWYWMQQGDTFTQPIDYRKALPPTPEPKPIVIAVAQKQASIEAESKAGSK